MENGKYDAADLSAQQTDNSTVVKSALDQEHDFYFSEKQKDIKKSVHVTADGPVLLCLYKGHEYTEAIRSNSGVKSNWGDAVFLGRGTIRGDVEIRST